MVVAPAIGLSSRALRVCGTARAELTARSTVKGSATLNGPARPDAPVWRTWKA